MVEELGDISGVGTKTKHKLKQVGVESLDDLAEAEIDDLTEAGMSDSRAREFIEKAKQSTVQIQTGADVSQEYEEKSFLSTGMETMDEMLGGGWEEGCVVALPGESGTGKTQLAFQSMVHAVEQTGLPAVYIETERNRYRPERLEKLANEEDTQDNIYRIKAYDLDQQMMAYKKLQNEFEELAIVVVDSFTARFRLAEKFDGRANLSERSAEMGAHLTELENMAEIIDAPILITAQVYSNPGQYGKSEYIYGGSLFMHTVGYFVHMQNDSGKMVEAQLRNHPGRDDQELSIRIDDEELEAIAD